MKRVEAVLQSLNVKRQQYHGGAFICNHVHKVLQVSKNKKQHFWLNSTVYFLT